MAVYATYSDLTTMGINAAALANVTLAQQSAALASASARADGYLASQYTLPISAWGTDLTENVCAIAIWTIMAARGYNPEGSDNLIRIRYLDAIAWLESVADGKIAPPAIVDSTPNTREGAPVVITGLNGNVVGGNFNPTNMFSDSPASYNGGPVPGKRGW